MALNVEDVVAKILGPDESWDRAFETCSAIERDLKAAKRNVDDFALNCITPFIRGETPANKTLFVSVVGLFFWHRWRRGLSWKNAEKPVPNDAQFDKLARTLARCRRTLSGEFLLVIDAFEAMLYASYGRIGDAGRLLAPVRANGYPKRAPQQAFFDGAQSFVAHVDDETPLSLELPQLELKGPGPLLVTSCDQAYFDQFAMDFAHSAKEAFPESDTLIFLSDVTVASVEQVADSCWKVGVPTAFAKTPALHASLRYLVARELLDRFDRTVAIFDVDHHHNKLMRPYVLEAGELDMSLAFNNYPHSKAPWASISAAASVFNPTEPAKFLLEQFGTYFANVYDDTKSNWWIDQNALFHGFRKAQFHYPTMRVGDSAEVVRLGALNADLDVIKFKRSSRGAFRADN